MNVLAQDVTLQTKIRSETSTTRREVLSQASIVEHPLRVHAC